jgi:hypothetical protein
MAELCTVAYPARTKVGTARVEGRRDVISVYKTGNVRIK